jgi:RIO-like serine/threonine protein kinase
MARVTATPAADLHEAAASRTVLKRGRLGTLSRISGHGVDGTITRLFERDTRSALFGLRAVARRLAAREARILTSLAGVPGVPRLAGWDGRCLRRSWLEGAPLQPAQPLHRAYFREALRLLRRLHSAGITHNDLARSASWLLTEKVRPALPDFRHARQTRYRGKRFRALAYADLRDLLELKRQHWWHGLTARERALLARQGPWLEQLWLRLVRPAARTLRR